MHARRLARTHHLAFATALALASGGLFALTRSAAAAPPPPPPPPDAAPIVLPAPLVIDAEEAAQSLRGVVTSGGKPLAGARVSLSQAWPRKGPSYYCPSCYHDCTKSAFTDETGAWTLEGLDPTLVFEVMVVRDGYSATIKKSFDPKKNEPVLLSLVERDLTKFKPTQLVRGKVIDQSGRPVAYAIVSPEMVWEPDFKGGRGGAVEGLDPLAVSNKAGEFVLAYSTECAGMDLRVQAIGKAAACFGRLESNADHALTLTEGGTVSGRLTYGGTPMPNIRIGLCGEGRDRGGMCFERQEIATKPDGTYTFFNVPAGKFYQVYPKLEDVVSLGCAPRTKLRIEKDGDEHTVPDLALVPGLTFAGRVETFDGQQLPEGSLISMTQNDGWESAKTSIRADGSFRFVNLPPDRFDLHVIAKGYKVSWKNPNYEVVNGNVLAGKLDKSVTDFVVLLGHKNEPPPESTKPFDYEASAKKPLRGAEGGR